MIKISKVKSLENELMQEFNDNMERLKSMANKDYFKGIEILEALKAIR